MNTNQTFTAQGQGWVCFLFFLRRWFEERRASNRPLIIFLEQAVALPLKVPCKLLTLARPKVKPVLRTRISDTIPRLPVWEAASFGRWGLRCTAPCSPPHIRSAAPREYSFSLAEVSLFVLMPFFFFQLRSFPYNLTDPLSLCECWVLSVERHCGYIYIYIYIAIFSFLLTV